MMEKIVQCPYDKCVYYYRGHEFHHYRKINNPTVWYIAICLQSIQIVEIKIKSKMDFTAADAKDKLDKILLLI